MTDIVQSPAALPLQRLSGGILPGVCLTGAIAGVALALRHIPGIAMFSPMILSIVIGIALQNSVGSPAIARAGVLFSMRKILRLAIILLGLQLTALQVVQVGARGVAIILFSLLACFGVTLLLGRLLGVDRKLVELIAAGTSICGASAVIATNSVTDAPDEDVAYAVACVTVFGSLAMLTYPLMPGIIALSPHQYGLWSGASIHEIAQVVAASFQQGPEAGNFGTIAKLSRVMMLAPMVLGLGILARRRAHAQGAAGSSAQVPIPWFVFGFIVLVGLNSLVTIPPLIKTPLISATPVLLSMALAAMGLETDIRKLYAKGVRPLLLGLAASLFIAALSLVLVTLT